MISNAERIAPSHFEIITTNPKAPEIFNVSVSDLIGQFGWTKRMVENIGGFTCPEELNCVVTEEDGHEVIKVSFKQPNTAKGSYTLQAFSFCKQVVNDDEFGSCVYMIQDPPQVVYSLDSVGVVKSDNYKNEFDLEGCPANPESPCIILKDEFTHQKRGQIDLNDFLQKMSKNLVWQPKPKADVGSVARISAFLFTLLVGARLAFAGGEKIKSIAETIDERVRSAKS